MQTNAVNGTSLQQGAGSLQNGQGSLQPQSQNGLSQSGSTSQPQQDVLGSGAFQSFDGLTVQGDPQQPAGTTTGNTTPELFFALFILLVIAAVIVFRRYKSATQIEFELPTSVESMPENLVSQVAKNSKPKKKQSDKKSAKSKATKKSKASAKKRK